MHTSDLQLCCCSISDWRLRHVTILRTSFLHSTLTMANSSSAVKTNRIQVAIHTSIAFTYDTRGIEDRDPAGHKSSFITINISTTNLYNRAINNFQRFKDNRNPLQMIRHSSVNIYNHSLNELPKLLLLIYLDVILIYILFI